IGQVRFGELGIATYVVGDSHDPQRFEVQQVPGVFLSRPFSVRSSNKRLERTAAKHSLKPERSAAQTGAKIWKLLHRKRKIKLALEPRHLIHGFAFPSPTPYRRNKIFKS